MRRMFLLTSLVLETMAVSAASLCSGSSAGVAIDTTLGARTAAASETIRYGATWETTAEGATAVVAVDGEMLKSATGTGSVDWTPTRNGTYTFTHKVLAGGAQVGETLTATFVVEGLNPEDPVIMPVSGTTFDSSQTISMSCSSDGATIHYTTDGSEPTLESPVYKRFRISGKTTVKARAFYDNGEGSAVVTAEYALGRCDDPVISLADGTVFQHSDQEVSIMCGEEGVLRYTLDGTEPTAEAPVYTGPFTISESTVVKAKVFSDRFFDSPVVTANLTREWVPVATPVITAAESFTGSKTKVVIACATEGATIRYTTNGNDPNSHSTKYTGPFDVTAGCTVKAYGVLADYLNSEITVRTISKVWGIGDSLGAPDQAFSTSGAKGWTDADGRAMRSGAIADNQSTILSTVVSGAGTLAFDWRTSCEADEEFHKWDHLELRIDGTVVKVLDGETDWIPISVPVAGAGDHRVEWAYVKDDFESDGEDCAWVRSFAWTPAAAPNATQTTEVPVPYVWLEGYFPGVKDYEACAKSLSANGINTVMEAYVAGLDPTDPHAAFEARIEMVNGAPVVTPSPDLKGERVYKVSGRTALDDAEGWQCPANAKHRFFKISVELP